MSNYNQKRFILASVMVVLIICLTIFITGIVKSTTRDNTAALMNSMTQEQSAMVLNYVSGAERSLISYGTAYEVQDLLKNPDNQDVINRAQSYTEKFSETIPGLDGIYISNLNAQVLAHNNPKAVGITTQKGEALNAFIENLKSMNGQIYNTGIMISPATGKQIISMYQLICDENNNPIGFIGLGLYTDSLTMSLQDIASDNNSVISFQMIDVANNKYIFNNDKSKIGEAVSGEALLNKIRELKNNTEANSTAYTEENGVLSFYYYNSDRQWLFINDQNTDTVFQSTGIINSCFIAFCAIVILLIIAFNIIIINQDKAMRKLDQAQKKQEAVTKSLYMASMIDPIVNLGNRAKIIDALGVDDEGRNKLPDSIANNSYYFVLFNIPGFSVLNKKYGHIICDNILVGSADVLKDAFGEENVFRTGSDEFIAVIKNSEVGINTVNTNIRTVLNNLQRPRMIEGKSIATPYIAAIVKKNINITPQVIDEAKALRNSYPNTQDIVQLDLE